MPRLPRGRLSAAGLCAVGFFIVTVLAYGWPAARSLDAAALEGFVGLQGRPLSPPIAAVIADLASPASFAVIGFALMLIGFLRRGRRRALAAGVLLAGSAVSSQLLKAVLEHSRPEGTFPGATEGAHVAAAALPSGHATAAMALALAAVLVAPRRLRPGTALAGGILALAVSFSVLVKGWHFPSDVVAGHLLAACWAFGVAAGLRAAEGAWPRRTGGPRAAAVRTRLREGAPGFLLVAALAAAMGAAVAATGLASGRIPDPVTDAERAAFVTIAGGIAATGATLIAAVTASLGRRP